MIHYFQKRSGEGFLYVFLHILQKTKTSRSQFSNIVQPAHTGRLKKRMRVFLRLERPLINRPPSIESSPACVLPLRREKWDTPAAPPTVCSRVTSFFTPCQTPLSPPFNRATAFNPFINKHVKTSPFHTFSSRPRLGTPRTKRPKKLTMWHDNSQKVTDARERLARYKPRGTTGARAHRKIITTQVRAGEESHL